MLTQETWQVAHNAVGPGPITTKVFTQALAAVLHRSLWMPKIPAFVLKLAIGEQREMTLTGRRMSAANVLAQGFAFQYPTLPMALQALYAA